MRKIILVGNLKGRDHAEDQEPDGKIILKLILRKKYGGNV
jgi:hypothetical protein